MNEVVHEMAVHVRAYLVRHRLVKSYTYELFTSCVSANSMRLHTTLACPVPAQMDAMFFDDAGSGPT